MKNDKWKMENQPFIVYRLSLKNGERKNGQR